MNITKEDLTDLKYLITSKLVEEGFVPSCTDNDGEQEVDCENAIEEVFLEYFGTEL
jgi:hypothetical protein